MAVQIEARTGPCAAGPLGTSTGLPSAAMSSTGTSMRSSSGLLWPASTMVTGRWRTPRPPRPPPPARPRTMRLGAGRRRRGFARPPLAAAAALGASPAAPRRPETAPPRPAAAAWPTARSAAAAARTAPPAAPATAPGGRRACWAPARGSRRRSPSRSPRSRSRAFEVSSRYSDSGVVIRMSAASRPNCARSRAGVSPVRTATAGMRCVRPGLRRQVGDAGDGRAQVALDVHRQRLQRRHVQHPAAVAACRAGGGPNIRRSMACRNAASVLPLPVGASSRVDSPAASAGQASRWASVGAGNDRSNQARVGGWNTARAFVATGAGAVRGARPLVRVFPGRPGTAAVLATTRRRRWKHQICLVGAILPIEVDCNVLAITKESTADS